MGRRFLHFFVVLLCALLGLAACRQTPEPGRLDADGCLRMDADEAYFLPPYAKVAFDPQAAALEPDQIRSRFEPLNSSGLNLGHVKGAVWLAVCLSPQHSGEIAIELENPALEHVNYYLLPHGELFAPAQVELGVLERGRSRYPVGIFSMQAGLQYDLYIRLESRSYIRGLLWAMSAERFERMVPPQNYVFGLIYGVALGAAFWAITFSISLRRPGYLWFALFTIFYIVYRQFFFGGPLVFTSWDWVRDHYVRLATIAAVGSVCALMLWQLEFLELKRVWRPAHYLLTANWVSGLALCVISLADQFFATRLSVQWANLVTVLNLVAAIGYWRKGGDGGRLYVFGALTLPAANVYFSLAAMGYAPYNAFANYAVEGAFLALGLAMSLAMSERVRSLERLRREELEERVQTRTRELAAEIQRRRAAQKRAEEAAQARGEILANMSHEIRTPMNAMLGMAELLNETTLSGEQRRYVSAFHTAGRTLLRILNDVLDLSRIESGRIDLHFETIQLSEFLEGMAAIHEPAFSARGIEFRREIAPGIPERLQTDGARLSQILSNLLSNAAKFTDRGRVALSVARAPGGAQPRLQFTVSDTGVGIPPEDLERIFERFRQGGRQRRGGAGLGLSIARELARALGGDLTAQSVPGQGSVFTLTVAAPPLATEAQARGEERAVTEAGALSGRRVLIVDDTSDNRALFTRFIERSGGAAVSVESGEAAYDAVQTGAFDVILMDIQMPGWDGFETTERLREYYARGAGQRPPILAVTAFAVGSEFDRVQSFGFDAALTKPVTRAELTAAIVATLAARD